MDNKTTINLQYVIYKLKIFHVKNNKIINNKNYLQVIMIQTIISQINKSPKLHAIYEILHRALTSVQVTIKRLEIDRVKRIQYKKKILFQNKKFSAFRKKLLIDFFCKIMINWYFIHANQPWWNFMILDWLKTRNIWSTVSGGLL